MYNHYIYAHSYLQTHIFYACIYICTYVYYTHTLDWLAGRLCRAGGRGRAVGRQCVSALAAFFFLKNGMCVCVPMPVMCLVSQKCVCLYVCVCVDVCVCWYACVYCSHTHCTRTHACTTHAHIICLFCCGYCVTSQCSLNRFEVDQKCSPSFLIESVLCIVHAFMIPTHIICLYSSV